MILNIKARKTTVTKAMENTIKEKLSFLDKFLKEDTKVHVTAEIISELDQKLSVSFLHNGVVFKAEAVSDSIYFALDSVSERIKKQITKHKDMKRTVRGSRIPGTEIPYYGAKDEEYPIIKRKVFNMKPMGELEAIEEMKLLGHTSFMFMNADSDFVVCLIYKRKDGMYGIIEGVLGEE